jgi:hypothetical protein
VLAKLKFFFDFRLQRLVKYVDLDRNKLFLWIVMDVVQDNVSISIILTSI